MMRCALPAEASGVHGKDPLRIVSGQGSDRHGELSFDGFGLLPFAETAA